MKDPLEELVSRLHGLVAEYRDASSIVDLGRERSVQYGNLRFEHFEGDPVARIGVIYETPPGSTNQIMIEYNRSNNVFRVPKLDSPQDVELKSPEEVLKLVRAHIEAIPRRRWERLKTYIDSWLEEKLPRTEMWEALAAMCKQQMKGGRITHDELDKASRYIVARTRGNYRPAPAAQAERH